MTFATPCGPFSIAVTAEGALAATAFGDSAALARRLPAGVTLAAVAATGPAAAVRLAAETRAQVGAYFAGERRDFTLPLAPAGSVFQLRVWSALARIPFAETRSYGQLAAELDSAPRAVGRANATNPLCLIVPCHRVIGADGSLTGFAFGEPLKAALLAHERATLGAHRPGLAPLVTA